MQTGKASLVITYYTVHALGGVIEECDMEHLIHMWMNGRYSETEEYFDLSCFCFLFFIGLLELFPHTV